MVLNSELNNNYGVFSIIFRVSDRVSKYMWALIPSISFRALFWVIYLREGSRRMLREGIHILFIYVEKKISVKENIGSC